MTFPRGSWRTYPATVELAGSTAELSVGEEFSRTRRRLRLERSRDAQMATNAVRSAAWRQKRKAERNG